MIKVELLNKLLNIKDEDLRNFSLEQLKLLLGVFRYVVRILEREVNHRCSKGLIGNIF